MLTTSPRAMHPDEMDCMVSEPKAAPGIFLASERLAKHIEENQMLTAQLRERLGSVTRPADPRPEGRNRNAEPGRVTSHMADTLLNLGERLADTNREIVTLLQTLDL